MYKEKKNERRIFILEYIFPQVIITQTYNVITFYLIWLLKNVPVS